MDKRIPPRPARSAARRPRTLGPVAYLEHHLPGEWWQELFDSLYLRTDGDVVENDINTIAEADLLVQSTGIRPGIGSWTSAAARGGMPSSWPVAVSSTSRAWTARAIWCSSRAAGVRSSAWRSLSARAMHASCGSPTAASTDLRLCTASSGTSRNGARPGGREGHRFSVAPPPRPFRSQVLVPGPIR
jgi:hypothetical protein